MSFNPECLQENWREFGHTAQGWLLPCCWMERGQTPIDSIHETLFEEDIKLSNVNSINDILNSNQWQNFYKSLQSYETACTRCQSKCGRK